MRSNRTLLCVSTNLRHPRRATNPPITQLWLPRHKAKQAVINLRRYFRRMDRLADANSPSFRRASNDLRTLRSALTQAQFRGYDTAVCG